MGTAESKPPPPPLEGRGGGGSARVSLEYIEEDVKLTLDQLIPTDLPSLWSHQWIKSYADDHLLYASIWDAPSPLKRKAVVVFCHGCGLHSHIYDNPFLKHLARNNFIAFSYDRRGHGRTGKASMKFGDIGGDHNSRLCDLAAVIDAATHTFPDLPVFVAGHGTGGAEVLGFLSRWSKSSQARLLKGALLFAPGYGDGFFCTDKMKAKNTSSKIYPALVLTGHVTAAMVESTQGMTLVVAAARKLFRRYSEGDGTISETMLERCLNVPLKMDISDAEVHTMFKILAEGKSKLNVEELIVSVLLAGAPDQFVSASSIISRHLETFKTHIDSLLEARVHDVKPPLYWVHGTHDQVNTLEWAEKVIKAAGTQDTTMKLYPELRHGVFMDEDAQVVVQGAIEWINKYLPEQAAAEQPSVAAAASRDSLFDAFSVSLTSS